ncbi:MAG: AAA family ATPase [Clostridiales bacterium]|nr:AAA family ATPase [Clostridiales bacterium]
MLRTKLYFDVNDTEFFNRLKQYILANYGMYFEITENAEIGPGVCIISDYINRRNRKGIFLIKEDKGDISKYCCASDICLALMKANNIGNGKKVSHGNNGPIMICVTSASGGVGKSTVSKAMSCNFATSGKKVLYVNPNPFSSYEQIFIEAEKNSYTRLRYYVRKKSGDISTLIRGLASRDAERRVDFIVNSKPSVDGFIKKDEASWLMTELGSRCPYDIIIFDIPSYPGDGHLEIMKYANRNFLVYSLLTNEKHKVYHRFLKSSGVNNIYDVANFTDTGDNSIPEAEGIFNRHPENFWSAIDRLCKTVGEKNEISN